MTKKDDFVNLIKHQLNITLENNKEDVFNKKRNVLYTKVERKDQYSLFKYLRENNIRSEGHLNNYYWIWI